MMNEYGRACVVVLGDIGRSPRMKYHTVSLANDIINGVDLVGYSGSQPHRMLVENPKITLHHMAEPPAAFGSLSAFGLILKCIWQAVTLLWCLLVTVPKPHVILVQNPPGLPALFICWMAARLRGCKFVIDWHNYTWSILALRWNENHPMVRLVRWYEFTVGGWANKHYCVTEAMRKDLKERNWRINGHVFYDRPLKNVFRPIDLDERHGIMQRMAAINPEIFGSADEDSGNTRFTEETVNGIRLGQDKPAMLVSSTSWTADEDFGLLFDALTLYDEKLKSSTNPTLPRIVCVVTGKGPLKEYYLNRLPTWTHIQLCTPWLAAEDYPLLLASADLGLCLHASSSGLDLPMKAVDMLGCRIPVLALKYECIEELVKPNVNGRLFQDAQSLAAELTQLLTGFNGEKCQLNQLKSTLDNDRRKNGDWDWDTNWKKVVRGGMVMYARGL